ncbi:NADPH-dependent FMN reductase [Nonomuraea solani]|uniref:NADPH-dependent FMN reductase n=1 Tax=Nonomuraea solani TaxID=1144553 RepID=A0A1H6F1T5_9ACTN|nr:NAD(P)H-dependent oxidoreductase [Nonomuraea solani]SEH03055.1 NADPH-dependent FMN reductase [Nonomuraea solani]
MSDSRLRLTVIVGSVRDGRIGSTVATWFAGQAAQRADIEVDWHNTQFHAKPVALCPTAACREA